MGCKSRDESNDANYSPFFLLLPFQIISRSKNLGESKYFKFDQKLYEEIERLRTSLYKFDQTPEKL